MGSRPILMIVAVALVLGIAVYLRLWTMDFSISSDDAELLRRQFDLANREAMDESAEWRRMFDEQQERASKCEVELREAKESTLNDREGTAGCSSKLVQLQKFLYANIQEHSALLQQIEALKHELEVERLKCKS